MSCEFICDGCGKRKIVTRWSGGWFSPYNWFERSDAEGGQIACSRECIKTIAEKTGKTDLVLPV